jgi:hypothetical protein
VSGLGTWTAIRARECSAFKRRMARGSTVIEITTSTPLFMGGFRPERRRRLAAAA